MATQPLVICLLAVAGITNLSAREQRIFTRFSYFEPPAGVTEFDVICIGAGGGGRDGSAWQHDLAYIGGDGGTSSFGSYLHAEGGEGAAADNTGGRGGYGTVAYGGNGGLGGGSCETWPNGEGQNCAGTKICSGGAGAAGQTCGGGGGLVPGSSAYPFCGAGGSSLNTLCGPGLSKLPAGTSGPGGGVSPVGRKGGYYGGGGGSYAGGRAGGGGGYSRATVKIETKGLKLGTKIRVDVRVGHPDPQKRYYANPGPGVVIVGWGGPISGVPHKEVKVESNNQISPELKPAMTAKQGQIIYTRSSAFIVPIGIKELDVICIGGGGGGHHSNTQGMWQLGYHGGDGGNSSFGNYLTAKGGKGATHDKKGGEGGQGTSVNGGNGGLGQNCHGSGGAAGQTSGWGDGMSPGSSTYPFCGAGGSDYRIGCGGKEDRKGTSGPGGVDPHRNNGGLYGGGGAGHIWSRGGGGGGYSRAQIKVTPGEKIIVTVGRAGFPYVWPSKPAGGVVVVSWGKPISTDPQNATAPGDQNIRDIKLSLCGTKQSVTPTSTSTSTSTSTAISPSISSNELETSASIPSSVMTTLAMKEPAAEEQDELPSAGVPIQLVIGCIVGGATAAGIPVLVICLLRWRRNNMRQQSNSTDGRNTVPGIQDLENRTGLDSTPNVDGSSGMYDPIHIYEDIGPYQSLNVASRHTGHTNPTLVTRENPTVTSNQEQDDGYTQPVSTCVSSQTSGSHCSRRTTGSDVREQNSGGHVDNSDAQVGSILRQTHSSDYSETRRGRPPSTD